METYRTPDERFADVPEFPWEPRYAEVSDARGRRRCGCRGSRPDPPTGPSYCCSTASRPGRSSTARSCACSTSPASARSPWTSSASAAPTSRPACADHTFARHVEWLRELVLDRLDLRDVTLVGQDWGGLIGLVSSPSTPTGSPVWWPPTPAYRRVTTPMPELWWMFRRAVESAETLDIGRLVEAGCVNGLADDARAAYDAPFPDEASKVGRTGDADPGADHAPTTRRRPPTARPGTCSAGGTSRSSRRSATATRSPATWRRSCSGCVPGATGLDHPTLAGAGHFLQEDDGEYLGRSWPRSSPG